jgi:hypothetical protein
MIKTIVLTQDQWNQLYDQFKKDLPLSVILIRDKMKNYLGCTIREHEEWEPVNNDYYGSRVVTTRLDFFDEKKKVMFLLKYSEFINNKDI